MKIRSQDGISLFVSLIVLVAMSLAAVRLMRSTETTNLMAGNLAFKQSTIQALEQGMAAATARLMTPAVWSTLANDSIANGYYSGLLPGELDRNDASLPKLNWNDPGTWDGTATPSITPITLPKDPVTGVTVSYVVHRLCSMNNTAYNGRDAAGNANQCALVTPDGAGGGGSHRVGGTPAKPAPQVGYRITLRAVGPRGVTTIGQTILHLSA